MNISYEQKKDLTQVDHDPFVLKLHGWEKSRWFEFPLS